MNTLRTLVTWCNLCVSGRWTELSRATGDLVTREATTVAVSLMEAGRTLLVPRVRWFARRQSVNSWHEVFILRPFNQNGKKDLEWKNVLVFYVCLFTVMEKKNILHSSIISHTLAARISSPGNNRFRILLSRMCESFSDFCLQSEDMLIPPLWRRVKGTGRGAVIQLASTWTGRSNRELRARIRTSHLHHLHHLQFMRSILFDHQRNRWFHPLCGDR